MSPACRKAASERTGRLFVALWPDDPVRAGLGCWSEAMRWPQTSRAVPVADLHLTLLFIGAVSVARFDELAAALEVIAPPFELLVDTLSFWHGGLVVLTPSQVSRSLIERQQAIAEALRRLQVPFDERTFKPHVTLARRAKGAQAPLAGACVPVPWAGHGHVLAVRDGGHYRILRRYG